MWENTLEESLEKNRGLASVGSHECLRHSLTFRPQTLAFTFDQFLNLKLMNREANCSDNYPLLRTPKVVVVCVYGGRSGGDSESKEFTILGVLQTSVYLKLLFLSYITLLGGWSSIPTPHLSVLGSSQWV